MTKAREFFESSEYQNLIHKELIGIKPPYVLTHRNSNSLLDETIEIHIGLNNIRHIRILDTEFCENLVVEDTSLIGLFNTLIFENCTVLGIDCQPDIKLTFIDLLQYHNNRTISLKLFKGSLSINNSIREPSISIQSESLALLSIEGQYHTIDVSPTTEYGTFEMEKLKVDTKIVNFRCNRLTVTTNSNINLIPDSFTVGSAIVENCNLKDSTFTTQNSMQLLIRDCCLYGSSSFWVFSDTILDFRTAKFEKMIIGPNSNSGDTHCTLYASNVSRFNYSTDKYTPKNGGELDLGACVFNLDFAKVNIDELTCSFRSSFKLLKMRNCNIPSMVNRGVNFRQLHTLELHKSSSIEYGFFPTERDRWPNLKRDDFFDLDSWFQSFIKLRDQAHHENKEDDKDFYNWLSQNFRLFASNDKITCFFLWLYKWSSSFGRNPFYPLIIWLGSWFLFVLLHSLINIWPCIGLPYYEFYIFLWKFDWLPEAMAFASLGLFPLSGVGDQSIAHALVSSLHTVFSGVLFFLIGFCIRNHAKL